MAKLSYPIPCALVLWCDTVDRGPHGWRALKKNLAHSISTTHEECPAEELVPCPAKRCGGSCRARPVGYARITGVTTTELKLGKPKKKTRKTRSAKKKETP